MACALLIGIGLRAGAAQSPPGPVAPAAITLSEAVSEALAVNPMARSAAQQLAQAQARVAQAEAQRRFQITFNSTLGGSSAAVIQPPPSHETFGSFQNILTIPIPLGARPRLAVSQAQAQLAAAQAQYAGAQFALAGQVTAAYYDLLRKQALLQIAQETQAAAQRQLIDAQKRQKAGDVPQLDVLRAQVPLATAQANVDQADNAVAVARQALNVLAGHGLDAPLSIADVTPADTALPYTLENARARALQNSADIRAAEATVHADELAVQAAHLWREPSLSLQASDSRSNDQTGFSRLDTVQASVTIPLSDGGLARSQVREAEAVLAQAHAQAEVARQTALVTVSAAYLTAQSSRQQVAAARVAQDIAQVTYNKTVQGYQNGLFPFVDVLTAQAAWTQARIAYTQAVYEAAVAISALQAAVTGGTEGVSVPAGKGTP